MCEDRVGGILGGWCYIVGHSKAKKTVVSFINTFCELYTPECLNLCSSWWPHPAVVSLYYVMSEWPVIASQFGKWNIVAGFEPALPCYYSPQLGVARRNLKWADVTLGLNEAKILSDFSTAPIIQGVFCDCRPPKSSKCFSVSKMSRTFKLVPP